MAVRRDSLWPALVIHQMIAFISWVSGGLQLIFERVCHSPFASYQALRPAYFGKGSSCLYTTFSSY